MSLKYQISTRAMLEKISKLHLQKGDVLVCRDVQTLECLGRLQMPSIDFPVPLVLAPGGIEKLNRRDLLNLIEQLDQNSETPVSVEMPTAPL